MAWDYDQFLRHMDTDDPLGIFLRGLLWVERSINELLDMAFIRPDAIDITNFGFKLSLCDALGLLSSDDVKVFRQMTRIRNRLAHELGETVTRADLDQIKAKMKGPLRESTVALVKSESRPMTLADDLVFMFASCIAYLHYAVTVQRYRKEHADKLGAIGIAQALRERTGLAPLSETEIRERLNLPEPPGPDDIWTN